MSNPVKVFFCAETGFVERSLRRYSTGKVTSDVCHSRSYCDASVNTGRVKAVYSNGNLGHARKTSTEGRYLGCLPLPRKTDKRWPKVCDTCAEPFSKTDMWQYNQDMYYSTPDGKEYTLRNMPPGACYHSWWMDESYPGPDERSLTIALPPKGGISDTWCIDAQSSSGGRWTRTGKPEDGTLNVNPSIMTPRYHGFLRHLEGQDAKALGVRPGSYLVEC